MGANYYTAPIPLLQSYLLEITPHCLRMKLERRNFTFLTGESNTRQGVTLSLLSGDRRVTKIKLALFKQLTPLMTLWNSEQRASV